MLLMWRQIHSLYLFGMFVGGGGGGGLRAMVIHKL